MALKATNEFDQLLIDLHQTADAITGKANLYGTLLLWSEGALKTEAACKRLNFDGRGKTEAAREDWMRRVFDVSVEKLTDEIGEK